MVCDYRVHMPGKLPEREEIVDTRPEAKPEADEVTVKPTEKADISNKQQVAEDIPETGKIEATEKAPTTVGSEVTPEDSLGLENVDYIFI